MNRYRLLLTLGLVASTWPLARTAAQPSLDLIPHLAGGNDASQASAVSADGRVVAGQVDTEIDGEFASVPFRWTEEDGLEPITDNDGKFFSGDARHVSADGSTIVGYVDGPFGREAFRFHVTEGFERLGFGGFGGGFERMSIAEGASADGSVVVGSTFPGGFFIPTVPALFRQMAFRWTRESGMVILGALDPTEERPYTRGIAVTPDGAVVGYGFTGGIAQPFRWTEEGGLFKMLDGDTLSTELRDMSRDGRFLVGSRDCPKENPEDFNFWGPLFMGSNVTPKSLNCERESANAVSEDGSSILTDAGRLWVNERPYELSEIFLERFDREVSHLQGATFTDLSADGLTVVGRLDDENNDLFGFRLQLTDCNANGIPDEIEALDAKAAGKLVEERGTQLFRDGRAAVTFGSMIANYGRPWQPDTEQTASVHDDDPAGKLRALASNVVACEGALSALGSDGLLFAARELHAFEMLLGNEAFSDALDPTIGLDGIDPAELGDLYAFEGVSGIDSYLDEELAFLRGRDLPGAPEEWLNDETHYPESTGRVGDDAGKTFRAAIYNRLPPNAESPTSLAYKSNYKATDNYEAATKFPQGHGDAYGYYLRATKAYLDIFRATPGVLEPADAAQEVVERLATEDEVLKVLPNLATAMASRARTVRRIVDVGFRADFVESPEDPRYEELFADADSERAWSMVEWARRGALGGYLDWAALVQLTPADAARPVHREELYEIDEIATSVGELQERVDTAGAGLDPLGLVQNVIPFGIDASGLDSATGKSHYEQVRDAAQNALKNARNVLQFANQSSQRLREQDDTLQRFREEVEDTFSDFNQKLADVFGYPSPDDPVDNDLDDTTSQTDEHRFFPDLVNFMLDEEAVARNGWRPRTAPGEIQVAISELKAADLRVDEAEAALDDWLAECTEMQARLDLLVGTEENPNGGLLDQKYDIVSDCEGEKNLLRRMESVRERKKSDGLFGQFVGAAIGAVAGNPAGALGLVESIVGEVTDSLAESAGLDTELNVDLARVELQCAKEASILGIENTIRGVDETLRLNALVRREAQLVINRSVAQELQKQAVGRIRSAVQRGASLLRERDRLEARLQGELLDERFKDMTFRVFRNNALSKYGAFFDLAARYVVLAARAYAYEFNAKSEGDGVLAGIYRKRLIGNEEGTSGGLQEIILRLDNSVTVNNFNRPLESMKRSFSFRRNLLGLGNRSDDDLEFREFLESHIVQRLEDVPAIRDYAQISTQRDFGPALVIPFGTEVDGRNFFGRGPEVPFGNVNFSLSRNVKIRSYSIRLPGVDTSIGIDPRDGTVFCYLLPIGESILRENNNRPRVEDEPITPWPVVSQYLPAPPLATASDIANRSFHPWRSTAHVGGNYLGALRREIDAEAQVELGQEVKFNTNLAGRSAWNSQWLLVIPGGQWAGSSDPEIIHQKLLQFIYGPNADPQDLRGITDIEWTIQGYSH